MTIKFLIIEYDANNIQSLKKHLTL